jgi:iron complex transport system ATP-binding protein
MTTVASLCVEKVSIVKGKKALLTAVSLEAQAGEILCLLGNNGSGKSTLLRACAGIEDTFTGRILVEGADLFTMPLSARADRIAWLPQGGERVENYSALQYVALANERHRFYGKRSPSEASQKDQLLSCLEIFEATSLKDREITSLSGGEWMRVQLARVWAQGARVICLDEPNVELDLRFLTLLSSRIREMAREAGVTFLISTHDLGFAFSVANRLCALEGGTLKWDKTAATVFGTTHLQELYGVQVNWLGTPGPLYS